jgi:translation initiation factor IF-2
MTRKRIQELAKEWGMPVQAILAQLEKIGVTGKKPQHVLTEKELGRVKVRLGLTPPPTPVVGQERLVSERVIAQQAKGRTEMLTTTEQVIERRVGAHVIRRRTTKIETPQEPTSIPQEQPSAMVPEAAPIAFELAPTEEAPLPFVLPTVEEVPAVVLSPTPESVPQPQPVLVPEAFTEIPPPAMEARAEATTESPRPSRVLGRIDLKTVTTAPQLVRRVEVKPTPVTLAEKTKKVEKVIGAPIVAKKPQKRLVTRTPERSKRDEREGLLPRTRQKKALPSRELHRPELTVPKVSKRVIRITEVITVGELAKEMAVKAGEVIAKLIGLGVLATINQTLDADTTTLVAAEFGYAVENIAFDAESLLSAEFAGRVHRDSVPRAPVVTVMGHVDHGKTSLLDAIRHTNVAAREAGGIAQHIGAYDVAVNGKKVTFLDTPGHEAFTAMRARGAKVTDIVVLVVAADDGVMPQTIEAINHARAAQVPFVVALTKIDKPDANPERVKKELTNYGVVPEEWGGDTIFVPVSALTGEGVPALLEMLLLQADVLELKAPLAPPTKGVVVEAQLDKGRGPVATVLVQEGVLKVGDPCVCGAQYGKVRTLFNSRGQRVTEATPATPVEVLGLGGAPAAGDILVVARDDIQARQVAEHRQRKQREATLTTTKRFSLADLAQVAATRKELRVVIKADVQGSVEALVQALQRLSTDEVTLNVLHASVGAISETDVLLATASNGMILGFNIRPEVKAVKLAEREGVELRLYTIIYDVLADVRAALEGLLTPTYREKALGRMEVRQVFTIPRVGVVAGGVVKEGKLTRSAQVRLIRDHVVVYQGNIASLRRFKDDVREVAAGYECGVGVENFQDIKAGDVLEAFAMEQVLRRLEPPAVHPAEHRLSA